MNTNVEEMWCEDCDTQWVDTDYESFIECPNCRSQNIYRKSSSAFIYAYEKKHTSKLPVYDIKTGESL